MEFCAHGERFFENPNSYLIPIACIIQIHVSHLTLGKKVPFKHICIIAFNNSESYGKRWMSQLIESVNNVKMYLWFLRYRDKEHVILYWVNNDWNVSKGGWDNTPAVVPGVFRPDDVDLVIPQVTKLQWKIGSLLIRVIQAVYEGSWLTNWIITLRSKNILLPKTAATPLSSLRIWKSTRAWKHSSPSMRHIGTKGMPIRKHYGWMGTRTFQGFLKIKFYPCIKASCFILLSMSINN